MHHCLQIGVYYVSFWNLVYNKIKSKKNSKSKMVAFWTYEKIFCGHKVNFFLGFWFKKTFTVFHSDLGCKWGLQYWKWGKNSSWFLVQIYLVHFVFSVRNIITYFCTSPFLIPHLRSKNFFLMKQLIITLRGSGATELQVL